ncbi:MAG TPA: FtsX-like permease family protein [Tepidisphaeraceae bacterium]|jgi:putative ABC transport system permease protein|nr:FtsX-like permease family protein [Tepidisphaeraceae bacterium]
MFLPKLVLSQLIARKVRTLLTVLAITFSVSLVVAVTSGYETMQSVAMRYLEQTMGTSDAQITKQNDPRGGVDQGIISDLMADPDVQSVIGRLETETRLPARPTTGPATQGATADADEEADEDAFGDGRRGPRKAQVIGVRRPDDRDVDRLRVTGGRWFESSDVREVVIDQVVAELLQLEIGDTLTLPALGRKLELTVVGTVHKPGMLAQHMPTMYVPLTTLQEFLAPNKPGQLSRASIVLKRGSDAIAFRDRWNAKLEQIDPALRLRLTSEQRQSIAKNLATIEALSYLGSMVSMTAAAFIVFSTLAMGVSERQRTLAMMRAIGALRNQVAWLVVIEAITLSAIAVAIGVPLGLLFVKILISLDRFKDIFEHAGVTVDQGGLLLAAGGSAVTAILASLLPAWQATRVDPLAAMTPLATTGRSRFPWLAIVGGLLLISIDSLIVFFPYVAVGQALGIANPEDLGRTYGFYTHILLGLPTLMLGFFLLAPLFVIVIERVLGPVVSAMFGLQYSLLRQQLSGGLWRAAGTCASLMVGLAVLTVLQVQGNSALNSWKLPNKFPDVFIFSPNALGPQDQATLRQTEGIRGDQVMPIAIASPQLGNQLVGIGAALQFFPDATMFFGLEPDLMFEMLELDFRDDEGRSVSDSEQKRMSEEATAKLKLGRHIIVTDEFRQLKGLKVGDKLPLRTSRHGTVDYTIAGIVWSPGLDVMASTFDMGRQMEQRTAASVFGSLTDAKEDFGIDFAYLFAANLDFFTEREAVLKRLKDNLRQQNVNVADVRQIKARIEKGLTNLLMLVSTVAFAAMAVASLGVANTVMASVRSRQWQFGVLRSIGVTRTQLLRLVVAEAVLLGLVGVGLGLAAGMTMAFNARQLSRITLGYSPDMDVPWDIIGLGCGLVMAIAIVASLWPAIGTARQQPLQLLAAGRASA